MVNEAPMEAPIKITLVEIDSIQNDSNSFFKLPVNMMSDYVEGDESTTILPIVCNGNTVLIVLDGGAGVSIVTK